MELMREDTRDVFIYRPTPLSSRSGIKEQAVTHQTKDQALGCQKCACCCI